MDISTMNNDTKQSVLILEDDEMIRFIVTDSLKVAGFDVKGSADPLSALQIIEQTKTDVAIVDMRIPKMSGEEFIIRAKKLCPNIHFIIHTGSSDYTISSRMKDLGISQDDVLIKPVEDMTTFATMVHRLCK